MNTLYLSKSSILFMSLILLSCIAEAQYRYDLYSNDDHTFDVSIGEAATWLATRNGLVRIDNTTDEVTNYNPTNSPINGLYITEVEVDNENTKWVASRYGLYAFDDTKWTEIDLPLETPWNYSDYIFNLRCDSEGRIWFILHTGQFLSLIHI